MSQRDCSRECLQRIGSLAQENSVLSASMTVSNCRLDIRSHVRPIEPLSHGVVHPRLTRMPCQLVVVSQGKNPRSQACWYHNLRVFRVMGVLPSKNTYFLFKKNLESSVSDCLAKTV